MRDKLNLFVILSIISILIFSGFLPAYADTWIERAMRYLYNDLDISDDTPHFGFKDTDDNVGYMFHLETGSGGVPYNNFTFWRGTYSGLDFNVNPPIPLFWFDNSNQFHLHPDTVTGTGLTVFGTTPTFTTSLISPLVIGGIATTSDLTLQTTSGVGAAGADMHFLVGNNGATEAMTILNSGNVGIGTAAPDYLLHVAKSPTANALNFTSYISSTQASGGGASSVPVGMVGVVDVTGGTFNHAVGSGGLITVSAGSVVGSYYGVEGRVDIDKASSTGIGVVGLTEMGLADNTGSTGYGGSFWASNAVGVGTGTNIGAYIYAKQGATNFNAIFGDGTASGDNALVRIRGYITDGAAQAVADVKIDDTNDALLWDITDAKLDYYDIKVRDNAGAAEFRLLDSDGVSVFNVDSDGNVGIGAAASLQLPNGANPTVDAAGEIAIDTSATSGAGIRFYADAGYTLPAWQSKSFVIDTPTASSDYSLGSFPANITIKQVGVLCTGGTNVIGALDEADVNGANAVAVDADITATAGTIATDDGSLTNPTIDANDMLNWHTTSISGTPTALTVTLYYTYDQVN